MASEFRFIQGMRLGLYSHIHYVYSDMGRQLTDISRYKDYAHAISRDYLENQFRRDFTSTTCSRISCKPSGGDWDLSAQLILSLKGSLWTLTALNSDNRLDISRNADL